MLRSSLLSPTYRHHRPSGQAVVTLDGRDFYLGKYDSELSRAEYDRLVAEWLQSGRRLSHTADAGADLTIYELAESFLVWADTYYRKDGRPTGECLTIRCALKPLATLYGHTLVSAFGPLALKTVRQTMVDSELCRNECNRRTSIIVRMFRWAVENEMAPPSAHHALKAVKGLAKGRSAARESEPVRPVPEPHMLAIEPHVSRQVWAMVQLQALSGARPQEVVELRGADLDMAGKVWAYRPRVHKTQHYDRERVIHLGPRAQQVLRVWLRTDLAEPLFQPCESLATHRAEIRENRKSPVQPSQRNRRKRTCKVEPGEQYTVASYRRVLDRQLQDTIYQFDHKQGVVQKIDEDSGQLATALKTAVPIIITTLQKFPFVADKVGDLPDRKYAVIVDEAHSSQSGEAASELNGVLAANSIKVKAKEEAEAKGLPDHEEEILKTMARRGKQPNISFFAFTATPKYKTLEVFGTKGPDGKPRPFHLYSMRQAIEERFILDVLKNYTTYKTYYRLVKAIADDPQVSKSKAAKALARFMSLHPHNVSQKVDVMLEHFRTFTKHKIGGRAKGMVVTGSRLHAVRYKLEFDTQIKEKGYSDIKTLVAFSGTVEDPDVPGKSYSEPDMNRLADGTTIKEKELPEKFGTDEYQLLLVAEKYQTGFDQPLLHTMYVDKRLDGIQAVQTLSRLNRTCPGKEDTFVLDFVNNAEDIQTAFQPFYEQTVIGEQAESTQLYELQGKLQAMHVFHQTEVDGFCGVFFKPKEVHSPTDHAMMNSFIDPAVGRFGQLTEEDQDEFRGLLNTFRNLYGFMSQVIPFTDSDLEKLATYARFLASKLPHRTDGQKYAFDDEVALKFYRLQKISEGAIKLDSGEVVPVSGPTAVGTGKSKDTQVELSKLIDTLNERFGTDFTQADELFFLQLREEALADEGLRKAAEANTLENFRYVFVKALEGLFIDRMEQNEELFAKYMNDGDFKKLVSEHLLKQVYQQIREEGTA